MNQGNYNTIEEFLWIEIRPFTENVKKAFRMTQDGVINKFIKTFRMDNFNNNTTHMDVKYHLGGNKKGKLTQYQDWWKYASVIRILMYVARNSRPEIAFAVH